MKDLSKEGQHGYERSSYAETSWANTFSIGIFKWVKTVDGKRLKKQTSVVRVSGTTGQFNEVYQKCDEIVKLLNAGEYKGKKTVKV